MDAVLNSLPLDTLTLLFRPASSLSHSGTNSQRARKDQAWLALTGSTSADANLKPIIEAEIARRSGDAHIGPAQPKIQLKPLAEQTKPRIKITILPKPAPTKIKITVAPKPRREASSARADAYQAQKKLAEVDPRIQPLTWNHSVEAFKQKYNQVLKQLVRWYLVKPTIQAEWVAQMMSFRTFPQDVQQAMLQAVTDVRSAHIQPHITPNVVSKEYTPVELQTHSLTYQQALTQIHATVHNGWAVLNHYLYNKYNQNHRKCWYIFMGVGRYTSEDEPDIYAPIFIKLQTYEGLSTGDQFLLVTIHDGRGPRPDSITQYDLEEIVQLKVMSGFPADIKNIPNFGASLIRQMFSALTKLPTSRVGHCLSDYIINKINSDTGRLFGRYCRFKLMHELEQINLDINKLCPNDVIKWVEHYHSGIAIKCLDILGNTLINRRGNGRFMLSWISVDQHCIPIDDAKHLHQNSTKIFAKQKKYTIDYSHFQIIKNHQIDDWINGKITGTCVVEPAIDSHTILYDVGAKLMKTIGTAIESFTRTDDGMESLVHPISGSVIVRNHNIDQRMAVCKTIYRDFPLLDFKFFGQSLATIGTNLLHAMVGQIPLSDYRDEVQTVLDQYPIAPMIQTLCMDTVEDLKLRANVRGFDRYKEHSYILSDWHQQLPIIDIHCVCEPYTTHHEAMHQSNQLANGFYYLPNIILPFHNGMDNLVLPTAWYPHFVVQYLLGKHWLQTDQIKYQILTRQYISGQVFKPFIEYIYSHFSANDAKMLANFMIGNLGRKFMRSEHYTVIENDQYLFSLLFSQQSNSDVNIKSEKIGDDAYLVYARNEWRLEKDHRPIWSCVIGQSIIDLLEMIDNLSTPDSQLVSVNTDSCVITNPKYIKLVHKKELDADAYGCLGRICFEEIKTRVYHSTNDIIASKPEMTEIPTSKAWSANNSITYGPAGSGKSWTCADEMLSLRDSKVLFLTPTNKALDNMTQICKNKGLELGHAWTFDKFYHNCHSSDGGFRQRLLSYDHVYVDEFMMAKNEHISLLYHSGHQSIHLFGDPHQLPPVGDVIYDYSQSRTIIEMFPSIKTLTYIDGCMRFDAPLLAVHNQFMLDRKPIQFKPLQRHLLRNICFTNQKRQEINWECCGIYNNRMYKGRRGAPTQRVKFSVTEYTNGCAHKSVEKYDLSNGTPLIATVNNRKLGLSKNTEHVLTEIGEKMQIDGNLEMDVKTFSQSFLPAFCITVHKYQGDKINEPFNIWESNRMSDKMYYTAFTRATKLEYIHCANLCTLIPFKYPQRFEVEILPYNQGVIEDQTYLFCDDDDDERMVKKWTKFLHPVDEAPAPAIVTATTSQKFTEVLEMSREECRAQELEKMIRDCGDYLEINKMIHGVIYRKKIRYGKKIDKDQAMIQMKDYIKQLQTSS